MGLCPARQTMLDIIFYSYRLVVSLSDEENMLPTSHEVGVALSGGRITETLVELQCFGPNAARLGSAMPAEHVL